MDTTRVNTIQITLLLDLELVIRNKWAAFVAAMISGDVYAPLKVCMCYIASLVSIWMVLLATTSLPQVIQTSLDQLRQRLCQNSFIGIVRYERLVGSSQEADPFTSASQSESFCWSLMDLSGNEMPRPQTPIPFHTSRSGVQRCRATPPGLFKSGQNSDRTTDKATRIYPG